MALGVSGGGPLPHSAMLSPASIAFVALGVIWGSNFVFMKWASDTITPGQITFLRVLFGFLPILLYAAIRHVLDRRHLRYVHHFVVMSLLATSVYYFAFAAGTALLPSGIAGALSGAIPLFSYITAAAMLSSERVTRLRTLGVLIGFAGVLLIARPWDTTEALTSPASCTCCSARPAWACHSCTRGGFSAGCRSTPPHSPRTRSGLRCSC